MYTVFIIIQLTVIAADLRGLGQTVRTTTGTFLIRVLDINDNIPTFISPVSVIADFYVETYIFFQYKSPGGIVVRASD